MPPRPCARPEPMPRTWPWSTSPCPTVPASSSCANYGPCCPHLSILVVSMHTKADYIVEAIRAGANGYVTKDAAAERLLDGLRQVGDGAFYLDPAISQDVSRELLLGPQKAEPAFASAYDSLTQREREVMRLVVEGLTTKEVAEGLAISVKTAEHHRCNLMKKLGLQNSVELVRYASRLGLID